jgi:hypothetical protein
MKRNPMKKEGCVHSLSDNKFRFLPRRPGESPAGEEMEVDVEHCLAGAGTVVYHHAIPGLVETLLGRDL